MPWSKLHHGTLAKMYIHWCNRRFLQAHLATQTQLCLPPACRCSKRTHCAVQQQFQRCSRGGMRVCCTLVQLHLCHVLLSQPAKAKWHMDAQSSIHCQWPQVGNNLSSIRILSFLYTCTLYTGRQPQVRGPCLARDSPVVGEGSSYAGHPSKINPAEGQGT